jgi:hypothetical protein
MKWRSHKAWARHFEELDRRKKERKEEEAAEKNRSILQGLPLPPKIMIISSIRSLFEESYRPLR